MENLTAREEEVMQVLWDLDRALVRDIIDKLPNSNQPYTTVSSIVRILEKKGFVGHKPYGKTHEYFPLISKAEYRRRKFKGLRIPTRQFSLRSSITFPRNQIKNFYNFGVRKLLSSRTTLSQLQ